MARVYKFYVFFHRLQKRKMIAVFILLSIVFVFDNAEVLGRNDATILENFEHLKAKTSESQQSIAVHQLIKRLIPRHSNSFLVVINTTYFDRKWNLDSFELQSHSDGKIQITASSGVAASAGFNYYLKYWCNCHVSWSGVQLSLDTVLPKIDTPVRVNFPDR